MVCTTPEKSPSYSFSLQPSQVHVPRPPTRCHLQCCPFQTACPHPSLWDRNMEPHLLPYLWFVWSWWWCPRWTACYFPLYTPPYSVSSQQIWVHILRGKSTGCLLFSTRTTTNSFFSSWTDVFYEQTSSRTLWLKAFSCKPCSSNQVYRTWVEVWNWQESGQSARVCNLCENASRWETRYYFMYGHQTFTSSTIYLIIILTVISKVLFFNVTQRFTNSLAQLSIFLIEFFVGTYYRLSSHARLEAFVIQTNPN